MSIKMLLFCLFMFTLCLTVRVSGESVAEPPFVLQVRPHRVTGRYKSPIYIHVSLKNVTRSNNFIWTWFNPVPFGRGKHHLKSLKMCCYDKKSHKEVHYLFPIPDGLTMAEAQRKELPEKVLPKQSVGGTFNLTAFCDLIPGDYALVMQYDTTEIGEWIRPNEKAWHGTTNKVWVDVHILKSSRRYRTQSRRNPWQNHPALYLSPVKAQK